MTYTPTTAQIQQMRVDVGDQTAPLIFGYAAYASFYDAAEGDYALTVYNTLVRMLLVLPQRIATAKVCDKEALKTLLASLPALIELWSKAAGVYGGSIRVGVLSYDMDTDDDNYDIEVT